MRKLLLLFLLFSTTLFSQNSIHTYRNPVIGGDFPDPTVIRVGQDYYASGTTSDLAPSYPLYHSLDLINWKQIGSIFNEPPAWIKGDCWAPELFYRNGTYYAYYTARRKSDNITCIGVATTTDITKGFTDHGILIDWGKEAIDAYVFEDNDAKLYISWKAYGLDNRPIEILCSELSSDGLSLVGEHFSLTPPAKGWVEKGDEGQCIVKHGEYYYLLYSVGGCCDSRCDYRVQVARSTSIRGDWELYSQGPILEGGDLWQCSGHGTLVHTDDNRYFYLYHAYHSYDFTFVGRQGLLDELLWDEKTGWPYFKYGKTPSIQAEVPFKGTVQEKKTPFNDNFASDELDKHWLWDMNLGKPVLAKDNGVLLFTAPNAGICFRGINPQTGNYIMETSVKDEGQNLKGLSIYGNKSNLFAWGVEDGNLKLYKWAQNEKHELYSSSLPKTNQIYLRIESINAALFQFYWSVDQTNWTPCFEQSVDGRFLPQWGKGVRVGMIVENKKNNTGVFSYFHLRNKY